MTIDAKLMNALNALADTTIQIITETTGNQPNDYAVRDVARSIATKPYYDAQRKRKYIESKLLGDIAANTVYREGTNEPVPENEQPPQYHAAVARHKNLGFRIELEAMAFDALFEKHKAWFLEYTGDHLDTDGAKAPANKLTKAQQEALKKIEQQRLAVA